MSNARHNRLIIYSFYDKDGIADRYVDYMLRALKEVSDKIIIVANGFITPSTRKVFLKHTGHILVRENSGFDIWGYKIALEYEGWDNLRTYYEVVLINDTLIGPFYPLQEMFETMDRNPELDFWGMTSHAADDKHLFSVNPYGYIPEHIQSCFTVYRNKFLNAKELKQYWDKLPPLQSYMDAIGKHETVFTKLFADQGFRWDVYVHIPDNANYTDYYLLIDPKRAIEKERCPVIKKRVFFHEQGFFLTQTTGEQSAELLRYLKNHTSYNTDFIIENLIRTCHQSDFVRTLGLYYVLPTQKLLEEKTSHAKVALVIHLYYLDLIEETVHYASSMPPNADIYVNTPHVDSIEQMREAFNRLPNKTVIRVIPNRGRDVSSLVVGAADIIKDYEYVCFYHDKKGTQMKPYSIGASFSYIITESALCNSTYVQNVLHLFETDKFLGLVTNLPPHNSVYYPTLGNEYGINYSNTHALYEKLQLHVPIAENKSPVCPLGTVFWFRSKALQKLFEHGWTYEDFPKEPNAVDGTLLHAFERIYSLVVQDSGYYPAYVMPDFLASIQFADFTYYIGEFNRVFSAHGIYAPFASEITQLNALFSSPPTKQTTFFNSVKRLLRILLPQSIYKCVIKLKRFVFGPRHLPVSIDD